MATLRAKRGTDFRVTFVWRGPKNEDGTPGDPIDITGYSIDFTVTIGDDTTTVNELSGVTVTPLEGRMEVHIEDEVTGDWGVRAPGLWMPRRQGAK